MDSNGEIFHQVFSRNCPSTADVTFSAEMGSWNLKPNLTAVERAQCWINSWGEMMKRQLANEMKTREIKASVLGMVIVGYFGIMVFLGYRGWTFMPHF